MILPPMGNAMSMPVGSNLLKTAARLPLQYVPQKSMGDCANRLDMLHEID